MSVHELFQFPSLDALRSRIGELALALDVTEDVSPLLEPVQVGDFKLRNRLVVLPMEGCDGASDGSPDELTGRRYRRFAAGGAGLLWMEATAVVSEGRANPRQLWIHERNLAAFARLVEETRRAAPGGVTLILQLTHSGRYSRPVRDPRPIIAHHSIYLDAAHNLPPDFPLITDAELERLEDRYVEAARCARRAGFDGVDIKACHRYLVSELLASHTRENSRYGGSFENRARFLRNVVAKVRDALPGFVVTSRLNAYDAMAYPYGFGVAPGDAATPALAEPIQVVRGLRAAGAPLVNITVGNPYFNPHVNRPFDLPTSGALLPAESPLEGVARFTGIVHRIQAAVPDLAVVGGGYSWLRQYFPNVAAAQVRDGRVTLVGLGRMAFAYPDFARDLAERGRLDPRKVCVACSACTQIMRDGGRAGCVPRDSAIYEPIYKAGRADALEAIVAMAETCRQCNDPACVAECPARVNIPRFVGQIARREFRAAYETLREANALAAVCGYVCPSETLCEAGCINRRYSESVPIRHLQRWVARKAVEENWAAQAAHPPRNGKRVAVLGAGPAGIAAAVELASFGTRVTLLEQGVDRGGTAGRAIPLERLPDSVLRGEIAQVLASSLIEFRRGRLDAVYNLDRVFDEGFDAVLIALGMSESAPLPGERPARGVIGALEFLAARRADPAAPVAEPVLVLGGGNTAIDAAVEARRAGARDVAIVYRRSFDEMPAWPEERNQAISAGVHLLILTQPVRYVTDAHGSLQGVEVVRTRLAELGADGRRTPHPIPGTGHVIPAELVIEALGQRIAPEVRQALGALEFTAGGLIKTRDGTLETTRAGVFAAGDIVNGGTTVVQAVAEGTRAARELQAWL